ncbi:YraN family protein [bacterium]|nr:YraN family protein [bacterium]NBX49215.1 YraN family protein [bacterium]
MPSTKQLQGTWAEEYVVQYLQRLGWEILARQFRTRMGEIDVIARDPEGTWIFVEVKARRSHKYGLPEEAVTAHKIKKITRALQMYLGGLKLAKVRYRIDVVALDMFPQKPIFLRHFPAVG